jgi:hypothetical protein
LQVAFSDAQPTFQNCATCNFAISAISGFLLFMSKRLPVFEKPLDVFSFYYVDIRWLPLQYLKGI